MVRSRNTIATPPGVTIKEQLIERGMSQKEFSTRMDMSEKHISRLINGEVKLTPEVALRLEMVLGVPAQFWNNLEMIYREKLVRANAENQMDEDLQIAKEFPYSEMARHGWLPRTRKAVEKVTHLRQFFGVAHLSLILSDQLSPRIAFRRLKMTERSDLILFSWVQQARIIARDIDTSSTNLQKLESSMPQLREMTQMESDAFMLPLTKLLAQCGIAFVLLPHIQGSYLHGATFHDGKKIVLGMTVRGKDDDKFWFSLFHELAHILLGHLGLPLGTSEQEERDADVYAANLLIPDPAFQQFVAQAQFTEESITSFATEIRIDTGIVVGRLQKQGCIKFSDFNHLKKRFELPFITEK